jgi:hypothetical protein
LRVSISSHHDHLKATYVSSRDALIVEIGKVTRPLQSARQEAGRAASLIAEEAKKQGQELWLCLSGGVDSECMARAFLDAGVLFRVAILRFEDGLNEFDIKDALRFCEENGVTFRIFDLDILDFFESGRYLYYAEKYRCRSPQLAAHHFLLEQIPGFPVLAWNVCSMYRARQSSRYRIALPDELYLSYHRFFETEKRPGVPFFFLYTPELFYSFFHTPTYRDLLHQVGPLRDQVFHYLLKCRIYRESGFEIEPREDKFTGFEKVKKHYENTTALGPNAFNLSFRKPLEKLYPDPVRFYSRISARHLPGPPA